MEKDQNEYVTVMICVAVHGKPIIGVVHQPFLPSPPRDVPTPGSSTLGNDNNNNSNNNNGPASDGEQPSHGRTYWAWVGKDKNFDVAPKETVTTTSMGGEIGASNDGARRTIDSPPKLSSSSSSERPVPRVIISQSHTGDAPSVLESSLGDVNLIKAGGAGYKTLAVIRRKADLYYHHTRIKVRRRLRLHNSH